MKKLLFSPLFIIICYLLIPSFAFAQSATEVEELLSMDALSYEEAVWFVMRVAEIPDVSGPAEAFSFAAERKWLPARALPDGKAKLNGISLLIMRSFELKGGFLYTCTKSPHHAYRELTYKGIIQGRTAPNSDVSGDLLLYMTGNLLSLTENEL